MNMKLLNWLKKRKLRSLKEQLAMVNARIDCERYVANKTGKLYPNVMASNAEEHASLSFRIAELEGNL